ncbi:MAG: MBL fold metallo-hydrolase [Deltaproteobacteria bacterium]|nr:MBL fold metallo-hydrolase [Deltaproteobacteria bacterium]
MSIEKIHWLGHASFRIDAEGAVVYIDPWKIAGGPRADLVLVTHEHFDHCSPEDVEKVAGEGTVIVATEPCRPVLEGVGAELRTVAPGDAIEVGGVKVRAVAAYNTEPDRQGFHPRDPQIPRVGYVVEVDGASVYHTGDTDVIPEMEGIAPDIALVPVGGTYTMSAEQAAEAARLMGAAAVVPMHWGDIVGERQDAERFAELFDGVTHIMDPE